MTRAYDSSYVARAQMTIGAMLSFACDDLGYAPDEFWGLFVATGVAGSCGRGDASLIVGRSGIELALDVLAEAGVSVDVRPASWPSGRFERTPAYWTGWALAYYQWRSCREFGEVSRAASVSVVMGMYEPYHEMDVLQFCDAMDERMRRASSETRLKARRRLVGLTQGELAQVSGVPLRTIQQYEQRQKSIDNAACATVAALARALWCSAEDLLERA